MNLIFHFRLLFLYGNQKIINWTALIEADLLEWSHGRICFQRFEKLSKLVIIQQPLKYRRISTLNIQDLHVVLADEKSVLNLV